jgi:hypothetical protein
VQGVGSHDLNHGIEDDSETQIGYLFDRHLRSTFLGVDITILVYVVIDTPPSSTSLEVWHFPSPGQTSNEVNVFHMMVSDFLASMNASTSGCQ